MRPTTRLLPETLICSSPLSLSLLSPSLHVSRTRGKRPSSAISHNLQSSSGSASCIFSLVWCERGEKENRAESEIVRSRLEETFLGKSPSQPGRRQSQTVGRRHLSVSIFVFSWERETFYECSLEVLNDASKAIRPCFKTRVNTVLCSCFLSMLSVLYLPIANSESLSPGHLRLPLVSCSRHLLFSHGSS
jgi:hypothetical protein